MYTVKTRFLAGLLKLMQRDSNRRIAGISYFKY
jgi:hypothetical protein